MEDKINDGGPAFPLQSIGPEFPPGYAGMTLRDYFAAKALGFVGAYGTPDELARACYKLADAMLTARGDQ